jgi:hypothetical protein
MGTIGMTQYPLMLEVREQKGRHVVKATTSIERALEGGDSLQGDLRLVEVDYAVTLAAIKAALAAAGRGRTRDLRAYWFAGKHLSDFLDRLESSGFYLVGKNTTPARHLGISSSSIWRMLSFYRHHPDPSTIDTSVPWSTYREHPEHQ